MNNELQHMEEILDEHIPGFHRLVLAEPVRLCYASRNLCDFLGLSREELLGGEEDRYTAQVHPADRTVYEAFLGRLRSGEQTLDAQYRLVRSDGTTVFVHDQARVKALENGVLIADSVLTDITKLKQENRDLSFLNETMPCGFLKYTCETYPRITYINDRMRQILGFPEENEELDMYRRNLYMAIPFEERRRFGNYLDRVREQGGPLAGEMTVQRRDGTKAHLFGWVTKCINAQGEAEFQSACMDMTERFREKKRQEADRYLEALTEVYDKIFEYDLSARTVKFLHGGTSPRYRWAEQIPMPMEQTTEQWIMSTAFPEDRERLQTFFGAFYEQRIPTPPVIRYRALSSDGTVKTYSALFVKMDPSVSLLCCRCLQEQEEAESLRSENTSLKGINENMQKIVMHFTDGLAAFEIIGDMVTPLYASDNVCQFFGYSREQWMSIMKRQTPIDEFISRSKASYADFMTLLRLGEGEFIYDDVQEGKQRQIKAVCSRRSAAPTDPMYVMLYHADGEESPAALAPRVRIRTFGFFDVFVDDKPIAFRNEKSKELFALLVDRNGGFVSSEEAISYLWEEEPANSVTLARYRKVALRLKNILEEYGISDIVESVNGKRRLVTEKVSCDLYDYLTGREEFSQLFKGSYLSNYSWGEVTLAELMGDNL